MQELLLHFVDLLLIKLVSSIFSLLSSINLSIKLFLHLHFSWSKYSPKSHDLSHSHLQLLGLQIYPLSHIPLSINLSFIDYTFTFTLTFIIIPALFIITNTCI